MVSELLPGEAIECPDCGRRIGVWRGRIASHKTTVAKFVPAVGEDTVWTTARCNGSQRVLATGSIVPAPDRPILTDGCVFPVVKP